MTNVLMSGREHSMSSCHGCQIGREIWPNVATLAVAYKALRFAVEGTHWCSATLCNATCTQLIFEPHKATLQGK